MKLRALLMGGALVAVFGMMAVGCNDNPTSPSNNTTPGAPTNLQVASLSPTSVRLNWTAPSDTGITYTVSWTSSLAGSGSFGPISATTYDVTNLQANAPYKFSVIAVKGTLQSAADTMTWSGAIRGANPPFLLYEKASPNPSGFLLDASQGGPIPVSIATGDPTRIQLAIVAVGNGTSALDSVRIGPAFAFAEYRNVNKFDSTVFISQNAYSVDNLDTWYQTKSLDNYISSAVPTNTYAYTVPATMTGTPKGLGFYVRWTDRTSGSYRFARVVLRAVGTQYLQGTSGNRFVTIEVSTQPNLNQPYAKTAPVDPPVGAVARGGY